MKLKSKKRQLLDTQSTVWIAGLAATTGVTQAAVVQIDLINNQFTETTSSFNRDLTGGGLTEVRSSTSASSTSLRGVNQTSQLYLGNGSLAIVGLASGNYSAFVNGAGNDSVSVTGLVQVLLTDSDINGGALTLGFLEVTASSGGDGTGSITLNRIIFDDANTDAPIGLTINDTFTSIGSVENGVFTAVPEPSSLALLALGAAGVVTRRQRKKAA